MIRLYPFFKGTVLPMSLGLIVGLVLIEGVLRLSGIVREVGPSLTKYDPVYGKRLKANLQAVRTTPEFQIHYSINSLGFRGPQPQGFPKHSILFIGDSFTEGYGVSDGQEFPELVHRSLVEKYGQHAPPVVNAGIGNSGNGHWLKLLRREGRVFAPRLVVLQFTGNDFVDNLREHLYGLNAYRQLIELPVLPPGPVDTINKLVQLVPGLSSTYMIGFGYQLHHTYNGWRWAQKHPFGTLDRDNDDLTYRLWEEIIRTCQQEHWPLVGIAVEVPERHVVQLRQILDKYQATIIIVPSKQQRPDLYYRIDGHWNPTGHSYVTQILLPEVTRVLFPKSTGLVTGAE